jgi:hypothetical protein
MVTSQSSKKRCSGGAKNRVAWSRKGKKNGLDMLETSVVWSASNKKVRPGTRETKDTAHVPKETNEFGSVMPMTYRKLSCRYNFNDTDFQ